MAIEHLIKKVKKKNISKETEREENDKRYL